ncbi:hypothetical protein RN001_008746 [Aquatica leii]|uniref:DUF4371 domain-containing protein n=1 Tax=Aquatica leii TaxID=1421715 RepID=A0AAN7P4N3_9COLE|nr:hypothetical protein RN001_008746 [Aquatica leii]
MATKRKQRKTEDENREFRIERTENFAFIRNLNGRPTCLICKEKFAHNKKSNLERHFTSKHAHDSSTSVFNIWMQSSSNVNMASFVDSQEIAKRGKSYTDGEYIKRCFIDASEELFRDFKNKADILKKLVTTQIEDLKLVSALSIAVDESCNINDTAEVSLFVRFISHLGPKEELLGLLPLKGQTRGEDIANAVVESMDKYHIPLEKIVSILTDGAKSMTGVRKGFVAILNKKN